MIPTDTALWAVPLEWDIAHTPTLMGGELLLKLEYVKEVSFMQKYVFLKYSIALFRNT